GSPELVEVVDVECTHRALQRVEDVADRNAERERLLAIHFDEELRDAGTEQAVGGRKVRLCLKLAEELLHRFSELFRIGVGAALPERQRIAPSGRTTAPNR